ncbi:hypothetical protein C0Q70_11901 [Pomacea canaliculata]|uniref:Uncharacterized protein n=1 Tax=Pomacea canaliculata TaxID=400727 RepID=A0A2T7P794_POMCA|nr:hypothetical protein C0Q70_11901 [Pomacea canaliculata]
MPSTSKARHTVMCGVEVQAACNTDATVFDCDNFNPNLCNPDLTPFCLTNGTKVSGSCEAKRATSRCTHDLFPICLTNGTRVYGTCSALKAVCQRSLCQLHCHRPLYSRSSPLLFDQRHRSLGHVQRAPGQSDCVSYNASGRCTHDLIPHCLTNGTMVFGTCSLLKAVCHEHAHIDQTGHLCPGENTEDPCVSYIATGRCTHDLLPFCLSNGTRVFGTCSALQAVCREHASIDQTGLLCPGETTKSGSACDCVVCINTLFLICLSSEDACVNYNATNSCPHDLLPFCLTNGTMVFGTCSALKAVCQASGHASYIDPTATCPTQFDASNSVKSEHATARSCDSSAATSLLLSTFDVVTVIAVCVIAGGMMK